MSSQRKNREEDAFITTISDPIVRDQIRRMLDSYYREGYRKGFEDGLQKNGRHLNETKLG
ncbi:hypothetical protein RYX56_19500 [Alkalihalophilus lindianensis]|uniref:Uncharacterized protein n=1 Tax=Alkalihalophilus lindianensis TaxID=1630542 RepID=A0ABU3XF66_9BACI|nr:hypothetical protein [Alkalihalophilus lindianensis]MDV2686550.1 hypothetical protein [Alkalihalophilus lindianensis]